MKFEDIITRIVELGSPELPPGYDVSEMDTGTWGVFVRDEHSISFDTRALAVHNAWGGWTYDIGPEWESFLVRLVGAVESIPEPLKEAQPTGPISVTASPNWLWVAGMRDTKGRRVNEVKGGRLLLFHGGVLASGLEPDLSDAATLGCVEHVLLSSLYGEGCLLWRSGLRWHYGRDRVPFGSGSTKGEALEAALWGKP